MSKYIKNLICYIIIVSITFPLIIILFIHRQFPFIGSEQFLFYAKASTKGANAFSLFPDFIPNLIRSTFMVIVFIFTISIPIYLLLKSLSNDFFKNRTFKFYLVIFTIIAANVFYFIYKTPIVKKFTIYSRTFDDNYIDSNNVNITFKEKRNLILIFMESIELLATNKQIPYKNGQKIEFVTTNLIPNLYDLALRNIYFSNNNKLTGAYSIAGTTWTTGGIVATISGIPLKIPFFKNPYKDKFLNKARTLYDILDNENYFQEFVTGEDKIFGQKLVLLNNHHINNIHDYTVIKKSKNYINEPERVFGIRSVSDKVVFDYTKKRLGEIAKNSPFSVTILTLDTHYPNGYLDNECSKNFKDQYSNVLRCFDNRISDFINWLKIQDFYKYTTIVLLGDHPFMNDKYYNNIPPMLRKVYFTIINPSPLIDMNYNKERDFSTLDLLPTILASLGGTIEGNKLGLGVNLFSNEKTIVENYNNIQLLNAELEFRSKLYEDLFY